MLKIIGRILEIFSKSSIILALVKKDTLKTEFILSGKYLDIINGVSEIVPNTISSIDLNKTFKYTDRIVLAEKIVAKQIYTCNTKNIQISLDGIKRELENLNSLMEV